MGASVYGSIRLRGQGGPMERPLQVLLRRGRGGEIKGITPQPPYKEYQEGAGILFDFARALRYCEMAYGSALRGRCVVCGTALAYGATQCQ
eukprot:2071020-Rhodomonas_salina.1